MKYSLRFQKIFLTIKVALSSFLSIFSKNQDTLKYAYLF